MVDRDQRATNTPHGHRYVFHFTAIHAIIKLLNFVVFCDQNLSSSIHEQNSHRLNVTTTLCLKKVSTIKLSVTLANLNRFSIFCTTEKRIKFATKLYDITVKVWQSYTEFKGGNFFETQCILLPRVGLTIAIILYKITRSSKPTLKIYTSVIIIFVSN